MEVNLGTLRRGELRNFKKGWNRVRIGSCSQPGKGRVLLSISKKIYQDQSVFLSATFPQASSWNPMLRVRIRLHRGGQEYYKNPIMCSLEQGVVPRRVVPLGSSKISALTTPLQSRWHQDDPHSVFKDNTEIAASKEALPGNARDPSYSWELVREAHLECWGHFSSPALTKDELSLELVDWKGCQGEQGSGKTELQEGY